MLPCGVNRQKPIVCGSFRVERHVRPIWFGAPENRQKNVFIRRPYQMRGHNWKPISESCKRPFCIACISFLSNYHCYIQVTWDTCHRDIIITSNCCFCILHYQLRGEAIAAGQTWSKKMSQSEHWELYQYKTRTYCCRCLIWIWCYANRCLKIVWWKEFLSSSCARWAACISCLSSHMYLFVQSRFDHDKIDWTKIVKNIHIR